MAPCAEASATSTKRIKEKAINFCMEIKTPPLPDCSKKADASVSCLLIKKAMKKRAKVATFQTFS